MAFIHRPCDLKIDHLFALRNYLWQFYRQKLTFNRDVTGYPNFKDFYGETIFLCLSRLGEPPKTLIGHPDSALMGFLKI